MDKFLGLLSTAASFMAGYTGSLAFEEDGTDLQLIMSALYTLVAVVALVGLAILSHMDRSTDNKEST